MLLFTIYLALIPFASARLATNALRFMGAGGGQTFSYCFDPARYPRSLEPYRNDATGCTRQVATLLRVGDTIYVESPCADRPWVAFARSLVAEEIPPKKQSGMQNAHKAEQIPLSAACKEPPFSDAPDK